MAEEISHQKEAVDHGTSHGIEKTGGDLRGVAERGTAATDKYDPD